MLLSGAGSRSRDPEPEPEPGQSWTGSTTLLGVKALVRAVQNQSYESSIAAKKPSFASMQK